MDGSDDESDLNLALLLSRQEYEREKTKSRKLEENKDCKDKKNGLECSESALTDVPPEGLVWNKASANKVRSLNSSVFENVLQKGFSKLYDESLFSDLTLLLGEERIRTHRVVISSSVAKRVQRERGICSFCMMLGQGALCVVWLF